MPKIVLPIVLQLLGMAVIIAEFFVPSGGLLSVLALALLGYAIYFSFTSIAAPVGVAFVLADVVALPIVVLYGIRLISRSRAALRTELSREAGVVSQPEELALLVGKEGVVISPLRPVGIALIEGKRVDVVSGGEFIDKNERVTVASVTANQVVVRRTQAKTSHEG